MLDLVSLRVALGLVVLIVVGLGLLVVRPTPYRGVAGLLLLGAVLSSVGILGYYNECSACGSGYTILRVILWGCLSGLAGLVLVALTLTLRSRLAARRDRDAMPRH